MAKACLKAGAYNVVPKTEASIFILNYPGNYTVVVLNLLFPKLEQSVLAWVGCCPISEYVTILLRILAIKFSNSRLYMNE